MPAAAAEKTQMEVLAQHQPAQALHKIQAPPGAEAWVEAAIKSYFCPEEVAYQAYPDAVDTLKQLKSRGYCLGLYSNATDDKVNSTSSQSMSPAPWLSPTFSSAGWLA
jgi:FMN phosphatase YigB (HAD superfamily)